MVKPRRNAGDRKLEKHAAKVRRAGETGKPEDESKAAQSYIELMSPEHSVGHPKPEPSKEGGDGA